MIVSARTGLTLIFAALMLAVTVILSVAIGASASQRVVAERGYALSDLARQVGSEISAGLESRLADLEIAASVSTAGGLFLQTPRSARAWLDELVRVFPAYAWIGFADPTGKVVLSSGGLLEGENVSARPWFQSGQQEIFFGDVHKAVLLEALLPERKEPMRFLDVAVPVSLGSGLPAVLGAHVSFEWIHSLGMSVLSGSRDEFPVDVVILDAEGEVLIGPEQLEGHRPPRLMQRLVEVGKPYFMHIWADGEEYLTGHAAANEMQALSSFGWQIFVRQHSSSAMATVAELRARTIQIGLGLALISTLLIWWIAGMITRPIEVITNTAERLRKGAREISFPEKINYREGQQLVFSLKALLLEMQSHDDQLEAANQKLELRVSERTAELQQTLNALGASEYRLQTITDNLPVLIAYIDVERRFQFCNGTFEDWFKVTPASLKGSPIKDFIGKRYHEDMQAELDSAFAGERRRFESRATLADGRQRFLELTLIPHLPQGDESGTTLGIFLMAQDISAAKNVEIALQHEAHHDGLTGSLNRRGLETLMPLALARMSRNKTSLGLIFLDLDHFKQINDTHGHDAGDVLLKKVAERLKAAVRKTDSVVRIAGDEFVVVLESISEQDPDLDTLANKLLTSICRPVASDDGPLDQSDAADRIEVTASIGIAITHDPNVDPEALIKRADLAMYEAKRTGRNRYHIDRTI